MKRSKNLKESCDRDEKKRVMGTIVDYLTTARLQGSHVYCCWTTLWLMGLACGFPVVESLGATFFLVGI